jgi:hypothetical protein
LGAAAEAVSLVAENGLNILSAKYKQIQAISDATVPVCYLAKTKQLATYQQPEAVLYPFGLNQSQKTAYEKPTDPYALFCPMGLISPRF